MTEFTADMIAAKRLPFEFVERLAARLHQNLDLAEKISRGAGKDDDERVPDIVHDDRAHPGVLLDRDHLPVGAVLLRRQNRMEQIDVNAPIFVMRKYAQRSVGEATRLRQAASIFRESPTRFEPGTLVRNRLILFENNVGQSRSGMYCVVKYLDEPIVQTDFVIDIVITYFDLNGDVGLARADSRMLETIPENDIAKPDDEPLALLLEFVDGAADATIPWSQLRGLFSGPDEARSLFEAHGWGEAIDGTELVFTKGSAVLRYGVTVRDGVVTEIKPLS